MESGEGIFSRSGQRGGKLDVDMLLLDSFSPSEYGGTGIPANLSYIKESGIKNSFFLAGGLNSGNILEATKGSKSVRC